MKLPTLVFAAGTTLLIAGCGSTGTASSTSISPGPGGQARRGAAGELAKIDGNTLILNSSQTGDITVDVTPTTPVQRTSTGTVADMVTGSCIIAAGQKDAGGNLTAQIVRVSAKQNGSCTFGPPGGPGNGGFPGAPGNGPPGGSPNPNRPGGRRNLTFTAGEVTAVNGTSVTVQPPGGAAQTITVPTTVRVSRSSPAAVSDLSLGQCIQAGGNRDSSGTVQATNLTIVPPGPSGCFTGRGGFGGFGGGRRGGSSGSGGPPAGGPAD